MYAAVVLIFLSAIFTFAYWCYVQKRKFRSLKNIPGPPTIPVAGNIFDFGLNPVEKLKDFFRFAQQYGPTYKIWLGPARCYMVTTDPELTEFILRSSKHLTKSVDYNLLRPWLSNGLLTSTGSYWHKRRKIITPTFHFKILEKFNPVFISNADILIRNLTKEDGKNVCNIYPYITAYTLDTICETSMGTSVNAQENPNNRYVNAVKGICNIILDRSFSVWKMSDTLFQFSSSFRLEEHFLKIIHGFTTGIIERRRNEIFSKTNDESKTTNDVDEFGGKTKVAFLDLLLKATIDGKPLSNENIREEVDTFMFEGHDTTASAISFAMYELAKNPDIQVKVMNEIQELFGNDKFRQLNLTDLSNMKYTELVIKETLRLYPSVPFYGRKLTEDAYFNDILLPEGLQIIFLPFAMHRRSNLFKNPEKFYPERFLPESEDSKHPFAYIPFSAGPRNCIGQKFAMNEIKITLYKILSNFELMPADVNYDITLSGEVILKSANGIPISLKKRL